jgi:PAS domain S-box-containing protein
MRLGSNSPDSIFIIAVEAKNQEVLKKILLNKGYHVKTARSSSLALREIKQTPPDLILLDLNGVKEDSCKTCRKIKSNEKIKEIPVIIIDSAIEASEKAKAFEAGAIDYITKPYLATEILARVKNHIELFKKQKYLNEQIKACTIELKESHKRYEKLITNICEIIYRYELKPIKGFSFISPAVYKIMGYLPQECYDDADIIMKLVHPDDKHLIVSYLLKPKKTKSLTVRWRRKDQTIIWTEQRDTPVYDEKGELIALEGIARDITKQKEAEEKLLNNETRLREAQKMAQLGYWDWDIKSGNVKWSEEVYKIFGLNPDEFVPQIDSILELSPWTEDHERDKELIQRAIKSHEIGSYEQRFLRPDGSTGYYRSTFQGGYNGKGELNTMQGTVQDITERKLAEEKLKASEERYRILFENMNEAFALHEMIFDEEGKPYDYKYLDINPTFTRLTGFKRELVIGKTVRELIPETVNDPADWINKFGNVVLTGKDIVIEDYSDALGKWFRVHTFKAQKNQFAVAFSDITKKKEIEENITKLNENLEKRVAERTSELKNINKLLKEERDKAQMYLDVADVIILTLDLNYNVTMINKKGCEVFGYKESEMIGRNWYEHFMDKTVKKEGLRDFSRMINQKNELLKHSENYIITKRGERRLISWSDIDIKDSNGKPIGMLSSGEDITERSVLEDGLIQAKIEANEANRAKSEFLANISHEIRTPMNAILGFTELLSTLVKSELQQSYLESIKSSGRSLLTLINDILDFSKIEAGKMELEYQHVNLYAIFQEMSTIFSLEIADKGLEFIMDINPEVPSIVYIDEIRLRQVLINLLSNAVKFTEQGHVKLTVTSNGKMVDSDKKFCNLIIKIEDTGIGVPKDSQEKIFYSFTQQDGQSVKKYGGTGLGLPISKTLTKLMNGSIKLDSKEGKGSTFKIVFNKVEIAETIPESQTTESIDPKTIEFKNSKVLIVDDIEDNRNYLTVALKKYNLHLLQATNGKEALNLMEREPPDLVITDLWMPVLDGMVLQQQLQNHPKLKEIPVIAVSASVMKDTLSKVKENNFAGFLKKPFRVGQLLSEMIKHIPYKIVNDKEKEKSQIEKIAKIKLENIDAFLNALAKLDKLHKPLVNRQPIKDVKNFANICISVADEFNILILKEYGKSLNGAANNFDIDSLLKQIKSYKQLITKIKEHISKTK